MMPICENCGQKWTWTQTIKTLFRLRCPHCNKKQYETASSKRKGGMSALLPLFLLPLNALTGSTWLTTIVLIIAGLAIIFGVYPFILKLSNEEEALW